SIVCTSLLCFLVVARCLRCALFPYTTLFRSGGGRGGIVMRGLRGFVACGTGSAAQGLHRGVCMSMVLQIMCTIGSVVYDVVIGCRRARDTHLVGGPRRFGGATVGAGRLDGPLRPECGTRASVLDRKDL